jgi:hypothetical protein
MYNPLFAPSIFLSKRLCKALLIVDTMGVDTKKSSQDGFITMIVMILLILIVVIGLAFMKVSAVNN